MEVVGSYKYLGHILEDNLQDKIDINFRLNKFYCSTNAILRRFKHVEINVLLFLFNSYCKPVYGLTLWNSRRMWGGCKFKAFELAFNNTLKRILGVPRYHSNHDAAERCGQLLLRHHMSLSFRLNTINELLTQCSMKLDLF